VSKFLKNLNIKIVKMEWRSFLRCDVTFHTCLVLNLYKVTYRKNTLFNIFIELFFINEVFCLPTAAKIQYCVSNSFTYDSNKSSVLCQLHLWYNTSSVLWPVTHPLWPSCIWCCKNVVLQCYEITLHHAWNKHLNQTKYSSLIFYISFTIFFPIDLKGFWRWCIL
jgi:hypothetical protein